MRKRKSSFTRIIIILLLIAVGIIFGYIYMEDQKLDESAKIVDTNNTSPKEEEEKEISLDSEVIKNIEKDIEKINYTDKYNNFDVQKMNKYDLIQTAINGLNNDQITWCISSPKQIAASITIEDLNKSLNNYIYNKKIAIEDIINNKSETSLTVGQYGYDMYAITIDADNTIHVIGSCDGKGSGIQKEIIETKNVKAMEKGDEIYIYKRVAYGKINQTAKDLSYDYYKEYDKKNLVETVVLNGNLTWDKYNIYKQTFKKIDNKYYLQSSKID